MKWVVFPVGSGKSFKFDLEALSNAWVLNEQLIPAHVVWSGGLQWSLNESQEVPNKTENEFDIKTTGTSSCHLLYLLVV